MSGSLKSVPLGIYEKAICFPLSWEEKLLLTKSSGFDCLEMSIDGTPERLERLYNKNTATEVNSSVAAAGVPIYTLALTAHRAFPLGSEDEKVRSKALELVQRAIDLAESCNIKVIHLAGYDELGDRRSQRTPGLFRDSAERIVDMAKGSSVTLAIETMDTPFMESCTNIVRLCKELGSERLKCYADTGNLSARGLDMCQELRTGGEYIVGLHLKDSRPGVYRDVPFGSGMVDFDAAFATLSDMGYHGYMTAETWSYDRESFHPYLKEISSFLREKLNKY